MKGVIVFFLGFICCQLSAQVSLGTSYYYDDRYVISYEKVMNEGYELEIANVTIHEYLIGKKIRERGAKFEKLWNGEYQGSTVTWKTNPRFNTFTSWVDDLLNNDYDALNVGPTWMSELELLKSDRRFEKAWQRAMEEQKRIGGPVALLEPSDYDTQKDERPDEGKIIYSIDIPINIYDQEDVMSIEIVFLNENIAEERVRIDNRNDSFKFFKEGTFTQTKGNSKSKKVQVSEVTQTFDLENKKIITSEKSISERALHLNEVMDIEGNVYKTTTIGGQTWMAENLKTSKFNDGTDIPLLTEEQWSNSIEPGIISKDPEGTYYNFYTLIDDDKNVCPQGYYVPWGGDVADLYNEITPHHDHLKISGSDVKIRVYSPLLTPITIPLFSAIHLAWWGGATVIDAGLLGTSVASDVVLYSLKGSAALIDASVVSPFFGWTTKRGQRSKNFKNAKKYQHIDAQGYPMYKTKNGFQRAGLYPVDKNKWNQFTLVESFINDSMKTDYREVNESKKIDSLKNAHTNFAYSLKYDPFVLSHLYAKRFWTITGLFLSSNYFQDWSGLFGSFNIKPYRYVSKEEYPRYNFKSQSFGAFKYQPVLVYLLEKNNEFSDQFGFNLNHDNNIAFPKKNKPFRSEIKHTGITYINGYGEPGFFGINSKENDAHELNLLKDVYSRSGINSQSELLRLKTRVRCVKE